VTAVELGSKTSELKKSECGTIFKKSSQSDTISITLIYIVISQKNYQE
jgi:hypothetical protein